LRLSSRLLEILEASTARIRKGIFDEGGRTSKEFTRFKLHLQKIVKKEPFNVSEYVDYIITFCLNKFNHQVAKL
jgi:hypothetical protein